jgi:hypothetical protein
MSADRELEVVETQAVRIGIVEKRVHRKFAELQQRYKMVENAYLDKIAQLEVFRDEVADLGKELDRLRNNIDESL